MVRAVACEAPNAGGGSAGKPFLEGVDLLAQCGARVPQPVHLALPL